MSRFNGTQMGLGNNAPDEFWLDDEKFDGIGHGMLKSQNQLTYSASPSRQIDGSMQNINDYDSFILPKVEIGFKLISYETFQKLRKFLLAKRTFNVKYYDKDFNRLVTHEMYAEPDDLTAFFNLCDQIIGSQDFVVRFVATLNKRQTYEAKFLSYFDLTDYTTSIEWGRQIKVPQCSFTTIVNNELKTIIKNGYWKAKSNDTNNFYYGLKFYPYDALNLIDNCEFEFVEE